MATSCEAMDGGRSTDRAFLEGLASEMVYWPDEDYKRKFTQSAASNIWGIQTVIIRTLCPFACPLMLHLAWVEMSIGFLKHTPMLIETWLTLSKKNRQKTRKARVSKNGTPEARSSVSHSESVMSAWVSSLCNRSTREKKDVDELTDGIWKRWRDGNVVDVEEMKTAYQVRIQAVIITQLKGWYIIFLLL